MHLISSSYKLVLVCIVTIVLNTVKCIDVPSTDFLPPFTSVDTHSNNVDDDTYLTISSTTIAPVTRRTYSTPAPPRTDSPIPKITSPPRTTIQPARKLPTRNTLPPRTISPQTISPHTLSPRTLSTRTLSPRTLSPRTLPAQTNSPIIEITTTTAQPPPALKELSKLHERSSDNSKLITSTRFNDDTSSQVQQQNQNIGLGIYEYHFETDNGIQVEERGHPKDLGNGQIAEEVNGSFSYTSPEGEIINLIYTADENGFHPTGDHLPTAPPIPEAILRALKYIEEHGNAHK